MNIKEMTSIQGIFVAAALVVTSPALAAVDRYASVFDSESPDPSVARIVFDWNDNAFDCADLDTEIVNTLNPGQTITTRIAYLISVCTALPERDPDGAEWDDLPALDQ